jgi:predicted transcriptional regulator
MLDRLLSTLSNLLEDTSKVCAQIPSLGEVLNEIRASRGLSQKQLGDLIARSEAEVSRLLNNQIPQKFRVGEAHEIAERLGCSRVELAKLVGASVCYLLSINDLIDLDTL